MLIKIYSRYGTQVGQLNTIKDLKINERAIVEMREPIESNIKFKFLTDNPKGMERALQVLGAERDPAVTTFFGLAGLYGVDVVELANEYFKAVAELAREVKSYD